MKIQALVPCFNESKFIEESINSLASTKFSTQIEFEILVSDNSSTDDTTQILEKLAKTNPSIRVFRQASNVGARKNWLFLLAQSNADWIFFIDAHDKVEDGYVQELVSKSVATGKATFGTEIESWQFNDKFEYRNHAGKYRFSDNSNVRAFQAAFYLSHNTICHALIPRESVKVLLSSITNVLSFDLLVTYLYLGHVNLSYVDKKYFRRYVPNLDGQYSAFNSAGVKESRRERVSGPSVENLDDKYIPVEYRNLMSEILPRYIVYLCMQILNLKHSNSRFQFIIFRIFRYLFGKLTPWKAWVPLSS